MRILTHTAAVLVAASLAWMYQGGKISALELAAETKRANDAKQVAYDAQQSLDALTIGVNEQAKRMRDAQAIQDKTSDVLARLSGHIVGLQRDTEEMRAATQFATRENLAEYAAACRALFDQGAGLLVEGGRVSKELSAAADGHAADVAKIEPIVNSGAR